jgi:hypothetical protein
MKGDPRFAYPLSPSGQIVMPPVNSAFSHTVMALPISVDPPPGLQLNQKMSPRRTRGLLDLGAPNPGPLAAERVELPDDVPFDFDEKEAEEEAKAAAAAHAVERDLAREEARRQNMQQQLRRFQASAYEVNQAGAAALANQRSAVPAGMVSPMATEGRAAPNLGPVPAGAEGLLPIFEPLHNAREIAKQLVLLEDHLIQPNKHCPDCIRKHLLTAEALAEEAVSLDKKGDHRAFFCDAVKQIRQISKGFLKKQDRGELQQSARQLRKAMSKHGFSALDKASAQAAASSSMPSPFAVYLDEGVSAASPLRGSRSSEAPARLINGARVAFLADGRWLPGVVLGEPGADRVNIQQIETSSYGRGNREGVTVSLTGASAVQEGVIPLSVVPVSNELARRDLVRFNSKTGRPMSPESLPGEQLFFADLIQAVIERRLGADLCDRAGVSAENLLRGYGCQRSALQQLARAAVITALYETGLNPTVSNRKLPDDSHGLFQMNRNGGLGKGHAVDQLLDPVYNATLFANEVASQARYFKPLIEREAALQPTPVSEWIGVITHRIQRPEEASTQAALRGRTADQTFPNAPAQQTHGVQLLNLGARMSVSAWAASHPEEWARIEAAEKKIEPTLARAVSPSDMYQNEPFALSEAGDLWASAALRLGDPEAMMRAAWLHRYASDMDGYRSDLEALSKMLAGTTLGTEADRLLAEMKASLPAAVHAPPRVPPKTSDTPYKIAIGGAAVILGLIALKAAHESRRY